MQLKSLVLSTVVAGSVLQATECLSLTAPALSRTSGKQLIQVSLGKDPDEPNACGIVGGASDWFCYLPPTNGTLFLDTVGSSFDTLLGVYVDDGSNRGFSSLIEVECDDNSGRQPGTSSLQVTVTNGVPYYIMLDGKNGAHGQAVLNYSFDQAPWISPIPKQTVREDQATIIPFRIGDLETDVSHLQLGVVCADTNLVSSEGFAFWGTGTNRVLRISPNPNSYGTNQVAVFVWDHAGNVSSTTFALNVARVNHKPVAQDDKFYRLPGKPIAIALTALTRNDIDLDHDQLTVVSVAPRSRASAIVTKGSTFVTYTPATIYNAEDKFTYMVSDGKGGTATATVTIGVSSTEGRSVVY